MTRRLAVVCAAMIGLGAPAPLAAGVQAGDNTINVTKAIEGTTNATQWRVGVVCQGAGVNGTELFFGVDGGTKSASFAPSLNRCFVTEVNPQGATVTYSGTSPDSGVTFGTASNAITIVFDGPGQSADVTVRNVYKALGAPAPDDPATALMPVPDRTAGAASAVTATPRFTG